MENKINIAELLKDCPKGMELDCALFENLEFDRIDKDNGAYSIICCVKTEWECYNTHTFTEYGCYSTEKYSKCVIFPKGKTTWEGFQRPFKDGDIAISESGDIHLLKTSSSSYCAYRDSWEILSKFDSTITTNVTIVRLATEEEKEKLFDAIKEHGYKWNEETKTLEKLPKFKVGDRIKYINGKNKDGVEQGVILSLTNDTYDVAVTNDMGIFIPISEQDDWELVPNKFDITALNPFDKVLVRDKDTDTWEAHLFSRYYKNSDRPYICIGVEGINEFNQCIPYDSNKELLGTTDNCDKFYKTWE